jgi:DNA gyrase subunit B
LLTFFYRQCRKLIERGYLYIAQPPLYRIKRGNSKNAISKTIAPWSISSRHRQREASLTLHDGKLFEGKSLARNG